MRLQLRTDRGAVYKLGGDCIGPLLRHILESQGLQKRIGLASSDSGHHFRMGDVSLGLAWRTQTCSRWRVEGRALQVHLTTDGMIGGVGLKWDHSFGSLVNRRLHGNYPDTAFWEVEIPFGVFGVCLGAKLVLFMRNS